MCNYENHFWDIDKHFVYIEEIVACQHKIYAQKDQDPEDPLPRIIVIGTRKQNSIYPGSSTGTRKTNYVLFPLDLDRWALRYSWAPHRSWRWGAWCSPLTECYAEPILREEKSCVRRSVRSLTSHFRRTPPFRGRGRQSVRPFACRTPCGKKPPQLIGERDSCMMPESIFYARYTILIRPSLKLERK